MIRVRVVCGLSVTMAIFVPSKALSMEDLPAFGRPTMAIKADFWLLMAVYLRLFCHTALGNL
jgi:hypothetical protein